MINNKTQITHTACIMFIINYSVRKLLNCQNHSTKAFVWKFLINGKAFGTGELWRIFKLVPS